MLSEKDAHSHVVSMLRWMVRTPLAEQVHLFMGMAWWSGWSGHSELVIETPKIGILFEVICAVSGNGSCQYWPFLWLGPKVVIPRSQLLRATPRMFQFFQSGLKTHPYANKRSIFPYVLLYDCILIMLKSSGSGWIFGEWFWKGIFQVTLIDGCRSLDFLISRLSTTMKSEKSILEVMFYKWTIAEPCWTI